MSVWGISDLHLSFNNKIVAGNWGGIVPYKPMDVFGSNWQNHYQKIYEQWCQIVQPTDTVLMAGDLSWGMNYRECAYDFDFLAQLPGKIILTKGNHDYWWTGISKVRAELPHNTYALYHDSIVVEGRAVCGIRGWILPSSSDWGSADAKILNRELIRLKMALEDGQKQQLPLVVLMHYMPVLKEQNTSVFMDLMKEYNVQMCVYGHLHGDDNNRAVQGIINGIDLINTSADFINFKPCLLWEE